MAQVEVGRAPELTAMVERFARAWNLGAAELAAIPPEELERLARAMEEQRQLYAAMGHAREGGGEGAA